MDNQTLPTPTDEDAPRVVSRGVTITGTPYQIILVAQALDQIGVEFKSTTQKGAFDHGTSRNSATR